MPGDVVEDIQADAASRRNLAGNNLFENLGDPIQKLLLEVSSQGKEVDDRTMELLQHITVKQLAKIFEMLGQGEDPETILAWLKRRARKNQKGEDNWAEERKAMIKTGAERDPVAFFKEIEAANAAMAQEFQDMEEERQQLRLAKAKEREKARGEKQKELEAAKKAVEDEGGWWKATDHMPEADKKAVNAAFEKFATKNSEFDNADKDQDGEWWKADPYRRDWERNKGKGKKWTAVVEGAKDKATDPELAVREEFYKGNDWWKADKYKRDWEATEDAEWWKEEPYIKDWQQNKHEGARWKAADEESGLEGEGNTYPATPEEQQRREDWYKANGPRGVVKAWNAATEGDPEKCSVPEKKAREEFYRNGDWWKNDDARQDFNDKGLDADALQSAGKPQDTEWWKQEPYREDFWKNGPDGKKWGAITEDAGVDGEGDKKPAPEPEKKRREDWYKDNWWKQPEYKDDWQKNGKSSKQWKAPSEKDAKSGNYKKPVGEEERKKREEWYKDGGDEWWKQPQYIEDYFQKGPDGRHWPAKTEADGQGGRGQENKAKPDEQKKREDWYRSNWWKQPKYTDDFHKNGALGDAWQSKNDVLNVDKEWWKQAPFIDNWTKTMKPKTMPSDQEWWKQPQYVEDFHRNGPKGKQWTANGETNGIEGNGHTKPAPEPEKKEREAWYKDNWWKAPRFQMDWAKRGPQGDEWRAASPEAATDPKKGARKEPCSEEEQAKRDAWYRPTGDMWRAVAEEPAFEKKAVDLPCTKADAIKRDEWYRTNWWKAPEYVDDWTKNGKNGDKWCAGNEPAGKEGKAKDDPCSQEEAQKRDDWYRNAGDNAWWKEPQYCEDWANHGPDAARWTADNRPNANRNGGKEHPATPEEKDARDQWYKDNWWKTPACYDDWKKNGPTGQQWARDKPLEMDRQDPETIADGWWKKPEYIEDWLKNPEDGRHWTAEDPVSAAAGQGHKKPADEPTKAEREKWYKDNWWKAPSCADDWAKKGAKGDKWGAKDPDATKAEEAQEKPATPEEKAAREDWYRKHGDADGWWKKPQFIEDYAENGPKGKKWTAGNPTAGALGLGDDCPASGPEKKKREDWYKDNWWKAPKHCDDWAKGPQGTGSWKRNATPEEEKERDAWYKKNKGDPATEPEKDKRDAWFRKHGKEPSGAQLGKREDWYRKQLPDDEKAKRMEWMRDRGENEKRILADELPEALAAINEGQPPTEAQVKAVMDKIDWNRKNAKDDFDDEDGGNRKGVADEDEPTIGQDEFLRAVADTNLYVAPDEEEKEMQAEEEKQDQQKDEMTRQEEEAAYLAMDAEEEAEKKPEEWQRNYKDPENEEWWKKPKYLDDYQKDPEDEDAMWRRDLENGKKPADDDEQAKREQWMKDNWWKAPKFSQEWKGGDEDNWKKQARPDEDEDGMVRDDDETPEATPEEVKEREDWFKNAKNPERNVVDPTAAPGEDWKRPAMVEDYQDGGEEWKEGAASPAEEKKREDWLKDNWWKAPKNLDNWKREQRGEEPKDDSWKRASANPEAPEEDDDGMKRNDKELTPEQKQERDEWFRKAVDPEEVKPKQDTWESARKQPEEAPVAEPETWKSKQKVVEPPPPAKTGWVSKRQPEPEQEAKADTWVSKRQAPPPVEAKKDTWVSKPKEMPPPPPEPEVIPPPPPAEDPFHGEKLREEDFEFFGEKLKEDDFEVFKEEEAEFFGEKLREEDFTGEKFDEEIAEFFGEKLREDDFEGEKFKEEEAEFFGEKLREDDFVEKFDEEVAEFFGEKLREDDFAPEFEGEKFVNEDDEDEDPEYEDPVEEDDRIDEDEDMEEPEEEEQEAPVDDDDVWDEELDDDEEDEEAEESEEEGDDNEHLEDEDLEVDLEAALEEQEQEWDEDDEDDEDDEHEADNDEDDGDYEEQDDDPEKPPEPWMLPLPEVTNNIYLKSYFPVLKWHPGRKPTASDRRVWVVDHFAKSFYCLDAKGKMVKQHDANKLLQLERNIMDPKRARLMFFDAPKSYEVIFQSTEDRERFYETGSSIRPAIRVYAPSLTKPDTAHDGGSTTTTIDGVKENAVTQKVPNPFKKTGDLVDRELSGRCKINSSVVQDEPVSIWCGTFNMCGAPPPRDSASLEGWMPKGKYDLYAVGAQEVSYQKEEGEWFDYVQQYLGKEYLVLASMQLWDITLIVLCRKKCLLKITNVEGSTKATLHKEKCGMKGAAGICLKYHNTSMAFISCHLAARLERTKMRRINVEEIINQILLANKDTDLSSQFHHVFWMGDMNYRVEMEGAEAEPLVQQKNWMELLNHDQLLTEMRETGLMHGFKEAPITFAPTYRYKVGTNDYMRDRGRAPSYTDRILVKSLGNTDIKCTGYEAAETVKTSEHFPVSSTYVVRCVRPHASCFHRDQEPRPQFNFSEIKFIDQTHLMFRKPMVMMYSPFSEHAHRGKPMKTSTMLPEFTGEALPEPIQIVVQMTEYLERNSILLIFRDNAEPREDKMFRGSASMELKGCVEPYDEEREAQLDVVCLGRKVGVVSVKYKVTNYGYTPPPGCTQGRVPKETLMDPDAGEAEDDDEE